MNPSQQNSLLTLVDEECVKTAVYQALTRLHQANPRRTSFNAAEVAAEAKLGRCVSLTSVIGALRELSNSKNPLVIFDKVHMGYSLWAEVPFTNERQAA